MKRGSAWVLGILLGSILSYTGWNCIVKPNFIMGKTTVVSGKIIEVFPNNDVKSYSRRIKYVYSVDDKDYFDFKKLGTNIEKQAIGNNLQIVYSKKNPEWNNIERYLNNYSNSKGVKYYSIIDKGYIDMSLINGIFKYREYIDGGGLVNNFIGEYLLNNDSISFKHYHFEENGKLNKSPKLFIVDSNNRNHLIETETKSIFKNIIKRR